MNRTCDLCGEPCLDGQGLFGGIGDGGPSGAPFGRGRHWKCHTGKYGRPTSSILGNELRGIRAAMGDESGVGPLRARREPNVTKGPYNRSENAMRQWRQIGLPISEMGRRRFRIECPFCLAVFWAFPWSLYGGGKKCPHCGALHVGKGTAHPIEGNENL